jgi:hypothetical protein
MNTVNELITYLLGLGVLKIRQADAAYPRSEYITAGTAKSLEGVPLMTIMVGGSWETGGADGGNCWGGDASHYTVSERPSIESKISEWLDSLLVDHFPLLTFQQYKALTAELATHTKSRSFSVTEYYGNYTSYDGYIIPVGDVWDILSRLRRPSDGGGTPS